MSSTSLDRQQQKARRPYKNSIGLPIGRTTTRLPADDWQSNADVTLPIHIIKRSKTPNHNYNRS